MSANLDCSTDNLRREINALQGLLHFSRLRNYPDTVCTMLAAQIAPRTQALGFNPNASTTTPPATLMPSGIAAGYSI